ncbi:glutamyl-tRNA reductase [Clostridium algidicarnis]|uniref:glutamyl-tRNA reductase n=1 Tax=Clostridium algidicarnis TaxID=37659 RepID=UPI001C0E7031|nr:glutamyl-tRNA reductase [Clostridium algidicarnis]MBU3203493.1 glutamyl-tRNA reductase [Clostridium algidicarnis]MBU3211647.1 glutamyl-tRNA reductase [Clostridium algidicarnis]MBU3221845.1 glutamyl-tRNA reductase [Clostridium algidicarnis]
MIQMIGIKSCCPIEIREKLSIMVYKEKDALKSMMKVSKGAVIINTCNRTEIYLNSNNEDDIEIESIFKLLEWDQKYIEHVFKITGYNAVKHLMEVCSGFHSKILGEDQILGQVKRSYRVSLECNTIGNSLQRLFQMSIACGKKFRSEAKLYKIPVSSASIVAKEIIKENKKNIMLIGFGEVGKRIYKYINSFEFSKLFIVVRELNKIALNDPRVKIISYNEKNEFIKDIDIIVSCTSAPHIVIYKDEVKDKPITIFDLSIPRDVDPKIEGLDYIKLYNIDDISKMDKSNKDKRKIQMEKCRYIIEDHIKEFMNWKKLRELAPLFKEITKSSNNVYEERLKSYNRKKYTKNNEELVEVLLKSTSEYYVHRAMEILKEEKLKGSDSQCQEIIEKIFLLKN